ncbi:MAG: metallophosphoesterase [Clostridia bacterium]|nr:metallophosphoesterase [Clostridia bacterium]
MSAYVIETVLESKTATRAFSFGHITDSHLVFSDATDDERKTKNVESRRGCFENPSGLSIQTCFEEQTTFVKNECDFALFTGDILDFPAKTSLAFFRDTMKDIPFLYAWGNHDWNYAWEHEDRALLPSRTALYASYGVENPEMRADEFGGVIFVGLNNTDYQFTEEECAFAEEQLKKGKDVIFYFHIPLYAKTLCPDVVSYWGKPIVVGCDEKGLSPVKPITDATVHMLNVLEKYRENVLAVIAGHIHFSHEDETPFGCKQYVTEAGCYGTLRRFSVVPKKGCESNVG